MSVNMTTNRILNELAEHLADCLLVSLEQQGFYRSGDIRFREKLIYLGNYIQGDHE